MKLILASASPRRRELLSCYPIELEIIKPDIEEIVDPELTPDKCAESLALQKGMCVSAMTGTAQPVLSADTIVVMGSEILGKPADAADARRMLSMLSGRHHQVITGVAILWKESETVFSVTSDVTFKALTNREIDDYIATGEPFDKAGAYAVQGAGAFMVTSVDGSYSNVIGLPVAEVIAHLQDIGFLNGLKPAI